MKLFSWYLSFTFFEALRFIRYIASYASCYLCMGTVHKAGLGILSGLGDNYYLPLKLIFGSPRLKLDYRTIAVSTQFHSVSDANEPLNLSVHILKFWNTWMTFIIITKTCLYNFDPHNSKTGVYMGIHYFFLFLLKNIDCWYTLEPPRRGGSNEYHTLCYDEKYEKYQSFLSENFRFFEVNVLYIWIGVFS